MAKIILYCSASSGQRDNLITAAQALFENELVNGIGLQLVLMTPLEDDPLAVPPDSAFIANLDMALEIALPYGQPLKPCLEDIQLALAPVMSCMDMDNSYVLQAYQRAFKETGPKALRYHYLMRRREDFSRTDYLDYYVHHHYHFGMDTPLVDYYQTYICNPSSMELAALLGVKAVVADNISELHLDSMEAFLGSNVMMDLGPAAAEDEAKFVDRENSTSFTLQVLQQTA